MTTVVCAVVPDARAAQWYAEPRLSMTTEQNNNFTHSTINGADQKILTVTPGLTLGNQTEDSNVLASFYATSYRYPGREELNNTGGGATAVLSLDYERFGLDLSGGANRSVLLAYENMDLDASRFVDDTTSRTLSVNPSFRWSVSPTFQLGAATGNTDVEYSGSGASRYRDYRTNAPSLTATYLYSEITNFFVTVRDSRIEYTNTAFPVSSETVSESFGVKTQLTERLSTSASVGLRRTTSESQQPQFVCVVFLGSSCLLFAPQLVDTTTINEGRVYDANIAWRYEKGSIGLRATQDVVPSGQATSVLGTTFDATLTHSLSEMFYATLSLTQSRYQTDANTLALPGADVNYNFYRIEPGLSWRIDEALTANLRYGYTRQEYFVSGQTVNSSSAFFTLSWNPRRRYISY